MVKLMFRYSLVRARSAWFFDWHHIVRNAVFLAEIKVH